MYWNTGTHLAVDEPIQRFMGRAKETFNIPTKPEPEGFKIWVLANGGYVLDWMYHAKGDDAGPWDLDDFWTDDLGFSKTQEVVLDLLTQEGISNQKAHIVWLDNLFTSARLLARLKAEGFGAAGTVRNSKTAREVIEESRGTNQQKAQKEQNRGLQRSLSDLKLVHGVQLQWGQLYRALSGDCEVLEIAWKDQNVVFVTTVDTASDKVVRLQRRPAKMATNSRTSRAVFGDHPTKELSIPLFVDKYNHFMNGVDRADQLRSYYTTQHVHLKNWKPLWHFLLDTTITNCYKIAHCTPERPYAEPHTHPSHKEFCTKLAIQLFHYSKRSSVQPDRVKPLRESIAHLSKAKHGQITRLPGTSKNCVNCVDKKRTGSSNPRSKRKPLGELAQGTVRMIKKERRRPVQYPKSQFGCKLCQIHLCRRGPCWDEHLHGIM